MEIIKVSSKTKVSSLAGAIAEIIRTENSLEIQAIGAGAVNQAIKAMTAAKGFVAPEGIDILFTSAFGQIEIGGEEKTLIRFTVVK